MALIALLPAAMTLIRLISWISGIVFVGGYVRDMVTKNTEADIQKSQDNTVEEILNNKSLSSEQKYEALQEYLGLKKKDPGTDTMVLFGIVVVILIAVIFILSKRK